MQVASCVHSLTHGLYTIRGTGRFVPCTPLLPPHPTALCASGDKTKNCGGDANLRWAIVLFPTVALNHFASPPQAIQAFSATSTSASDRMAAQPSCVYNVPMALDLDLSRTAGLDPLFAFARNQGHIYDIQRCTVGPMPLPHFIETFLPHTATNRSAYLSHRKAFNGVPSHADSVSDVYEPLLMRCRLAMRDALDKGSRIHRDLSVGNVIPVKERGQNIRRGYLIDWDASIRVDEDGQALQAGRAGTFTFSSARVLNWSFKTENGKHTFLDDMESLIYVVLYCALLYLPHNQTLRDLTDLYQAFFDQREEINNEDFGGQGKTNNAYSRCPRRRGYRFPSGRLTCS
ncbi:hypothetical protein NUW54_g5207 [Trametes sanguinea]|uniref:Uncharacterized protein n=1 Tax=Trametes sanguinea TaxID=158606 RepID=A0ACC1PXU7_9APHY|nr:hypothetical protein NUW54_g5207 [Trametes sanguinea]